MLVSVFENIFARLFEYCKPETRSWPSNFILYKEITNNDFKMKDFFVRKNDFKI